MPRYRVTFFKTVCGDTGHETSVCQRAVEVDAESAEAALEPARALFCNLEQIRHWSFRSDACTTEELPMPRAHAGKRARTSLQASR
jgi:hypothetical protein